MYIEYKDSKPVAEITRFLGDGKWGELNVRYSYERGRIATITKEYSTSEKGKEIACRAEKYVFSY